MRQTEQIMYVELAWCPNEDVIEECQLEHVTDALVFLRLAVRTSPGTDGNSALSIERFAVFFPEIIL
jgi:hypothetical protein